MTPMGAITGSSVSSAQLVPAPRTDLSPAFIVGVDGSPASRAATRYGAIEALAGGFRLTLVMVLERLEGVPTQASRHADSRRWMNAISARNELTRMHPDLDVRLDVQVGDAAERLVARSSGQCALVVGKDVPLGATAATALRRSEVPVVVVPAGWRGDGPDPRPILLGLRPGADDGTSRAARAFARDRAERYGVPLRVVTSIGGGPDGTVLLLESAGAQLVVLGRATRETSSHRGSVIDTVIRGASVPVAVVPG
jgi:nucleotide-binding universal stress UspA family protein